MSLYRLSGIASLLVVLLIVGCSRLPDAATRTQQDPAPRPLPPSPSELDATPSRPLPQDVASASGFAAAVDAGTRTRDGRPGPNYWQQEVAYDLTARIFPEDKRLEGSGTITYTNNAPDALRRLHLELTQNLHTPGVVRNEPAEITGGVQIERVAVNGTDLGDEERGAGYTVRNTQLVIQPQTPVDPGETVTLAVDWSFDIPQAGAGARMGYSRDTLLFLGYWYPQMAVYDDVTGWMDDPFLGLAEFYADVGNYTLAIEAPEDWIVQSTGALQNPDEVLRPEIAARRKAALASDTPQIIVEPGDPSPTVDADDDRLTWRFEAADVRDAAFHLSRGSIWEAARTSVGDRDGDGTADSTEVHTFWRDSAPKWRDVTRYQQHALTFLSEYTGLSYPWPHMTAVEGGGIIGGGMEFPMMTLMGDYNTSTSRMLYAVTAHELAHMWVPMMVSTNERRYSWMDEGTTSFQENMARDDFFPDSRAVASDRDDYLQTARAGEEGEITRWSNYHYDSEAFVVASYRKPATLLVALRGVVGEEAFNRAFREFLSDWNGKHPYPTDFFNAFERSTGRDLDWFWYSWYDTTWMMDQAIATVQARATRTEIVVEDHGKVPMPVHITVTLNDGETLERRIPVDVWLRGRTTATATVNVEASSIAQIEIDAAEVFPDADRSNNRWVGDTSSR